MKPSILVRLSKIIESNPTYIVEGKLNKNLLAADARKYDKDLLNTLQKDKEIKNHFFTETYGGLVFKKDIFLQFISSKGFLPDSFTKYKIKIGLGGDDGSLLQESGEVVLNWPYKDAILEGGQDKEDQKRKEVFFNEILAPDQITRLLDDKVFTGWKRYSEHGEQNLDVLKEDDNLIIKGNNLVVLHSLKKRLAGKVKLIYIDPPYYFDKNKKEDTFAYNSNFKLSTWLTFMKNRLEVARDLLSDDGAIFVQISDDGAAELEVLLKEIFSQRNNNFINRITVRTKSPSGFASVNPGVFEAAEYIYAFAKNKSQWVYNQQYLPASYDSNYKWVVTNKGQNHQNWQITSIDEIVAKENGYSSKAEAIKSLTKAVFNEMLASYALENAEKVFQSTAIGDNASDETVRLRDRSKLAKGVVFKTKESTTYSRYVLNGREMAFYDKKIREIDGTRIPTVQATNIWTDIAYEGIASEGGVRLKGGKKPEKLIKRIIDMASNPGDLILDYHVGSGTTAAVAHKMGRRYVGIEQLYYGDNDPMIRLQNVINGDQTGVSKAVGWQGGGSFVYANIMNSANTFRERIEQAKSDLDYVDLLNEATSSSFLSYRVDPAKLNEIEFRKLSSGEKRQLLLELIDNNTLYVNYEDINDPIFKVNAEDKKFNRELYKKTDE